MCHTENRGSPRFDRYTAGLHRAMVSTGYVSQSSTVVGDDWCVSILAWAFVDWRISMLVVQTRDCSLGGPHWYRVGIVLFDRGHPRFWNLNPTILVDVEGEVLRD